MEKSQPKNTSNATADAIFQAFISPNESDRNGEEANVVDGLYAIARGLNKLANVIEENK